MTLNINMKDIDPNQLRDEFVSVERSTRQSLEILCDAKEVELRAEYHFEYIKVIVEAKLRAGFDEPGMKKPNEDIMKLLVKSDTEVTAAAESVFNAHLAMNIASLTLDAVKRRERVLTMMTSLTTAELKAFDI